MCINTQNCERGEQNGISPHLGMSRQMLRHLPSSLGLKAALKNSLKTLKPLFCPSSWATGLCEDLIKQNKGESRYSTRLMVLIKSEKVTDRSRTCAVSNSDPNSTS
ncbi:hypothetical protein J6590_016762 [Homalodisca vitripennis]|nr:hypothetical protein J6590_016762 [Homalodisca vitripennis]